MIFKPKKYRAVKLPKYLNRYDPWFAWYPITLTDGTERRVWLEWVEYNCDIIVTKYFNPYVIHRYRLKRKTNVT